MGKRYFCPDCCQNVTAEPDCNLIVFILLLLCCIFPGIIYWYLKKGEHCPKCGLESEYMKPPKHTRADDDYDDF